TFLTMYRRGSRRGAILLAAVLGYVAYLYASRTLSVMINDLFLVYVLVFAAGFYALYLLVSSLITTLPLVPERLPRRLFGTVGLAAAGLTFALWIEAPLTSLLAFTAPGGIEHY